MMFHLLKFREVMKFLLIKLTANLRIYNVQRVFFWKTLRNQQEEPII